MAATSEVMVGAHRVVFEAEDVIVVHFAPSVSVEEMEAIVGVQAEFIAGRPYFLILDFTRIGTLSAAVRRAVGQATRKVTYLGIAMYGASLHIKVMARLVNTALMLFSKRPFPQEFFDSHEAATAWVEALRKQQTSVGA